MKKELTDKLYEKYPTMFKTEQNGQEFFCEICVGDGWYNIIDTMCNLITTNEKAKKKWIEYKLKRGEQVDNSEYVTETKATQVKEKFGGLRFYTSGGNEFSRGIIFMGEAMSFTTCEECGEPGKETVDGWIRVLCQKHESERRWRKENELRSKTILSDS